MPASNALEEKVRDFYRLHAPHDIDKVLVALSLELPPFELFAMLAAKYNVPMALVQERLQLFDRVLQRIEAMGHHLDNAPRAAFDALSGVYTSAAADVDAIAKRAGVSSSGSSPRGQHADVPYQETNVELSPLPSTHTQQQDWPSTMRTTTSVHREDPSPHPLQPPLPQRRSQQRLGAQYLEVDPTSVLTDAQSAARAVAASAAQHLNMAMTPLEEPSLKSFQTQLVAIEAALMQRCLEVQLVQDAVATQEAALRTESATLREAQTKWRQTTDDAQIQWNRKEVELAEQVAKSNSERLHLEELRRRVVEQQRSQEQMQRSLEEREAKVAAALQAVASREATASSQMKLAEQERALCQKLSAEVLKRETSVRSVEKSLAAAKSEVVRLEDELNGRAKQLIEDEAATRRWASELEKKELTVQSIFEQLRHKGIHVSY